MIRIVILAAAAILTSFIAVNSASAASRNSVDILNYIPADTPYVFAATRPLPSKLSDKLEPTLAELLEAYQSVLRYVMAEQLVKMSSEEGKEDEAEQLRGLMEEVLSLMSLEGIRGAGIGRDSAFAFYGNGIVPVLRLELTDTDLFDAAVSRIEEKAGETLLIGEADGESYKYMVADKVHLVIATLDDQAVITVVPAAYDEANVAAAIGATRPQNSLKKTRALRNLGREYDLTDHMMGFVDHRRIASVFAGNPGSADSAFFAALGEDLPTPSKVCATEIMEMVEIAPRMVFGYSKISAEELDSRMIVELREDIATGLMAIPTAVPGLGMPTDGLISFGMSMQPMELRNFVEARLDAMTEKPYECEYFADLQAGVAKGREALQQPIPPVVYSFKGFVMNLNDLDFDALERNEAPETFDMSAMVAIENAEALVMMAAMMDPQVAALQLTPDGKAVDLSSIAHFATLPGDAFAALVKDALSVAVGEKAEQQSAAMLTASSNEPAPFISMNMDAARYYALMADSVENAPAEEGEAEMPPALREAISKIVRLSGSIYERMAVDVRFTKRGVEVDGQMQLSD